MLRTMCCTAILKEQGWDSECAEKRNLVSQCAVPYFCGKVWQCLCFWGYLDLQWSVLVTYTDFYLWCGFFQSWWNYQPPIKRSQTSQMNKMKFMTEIYLICGGMAWISLFLHLANIFEFIFSPLKIPVDRHVWAVCNRVLGTRVSHMLNKSLTTEGHAFPEALVLVDSFILKRTNTLDLSN